MAVNKHYIIIILLLLYFIVYGNALVGVLEPLNDTRNCLNP